MRSYLLIYELLFFLLCIKFPAIQHPIFPYQTKGIRSLILILSPRVFMHDSCLWEPLSFFFFLMNDTFRRLSQWVCGICAFHAAPSISWLLIWGRIKEGLGPAFEGRSLKRKEKHKGKKRNGTRTPQWGQRVAMSGLLKRVLLCFSPDLLWKCAWSSQVQVFWGVPLRRVLQEQEAEARLRQRREKVRGRI